jgi:hypothetical protein
MRANVKAASANLVATRVYLWENRILKVLHSPKLIYTTFNDSTLTTEDKWNKFYKTMFILLSIVQIIKYYY